MSEYFGKDIPKLGFGMMRLPKLEDGKTIDIEQTCRMVDLFLESGLKYVDTAYVYDDGRSEEAVGKALVARHPRDSFYLATKLNTGARDCVDEETAKKEFYTSLERTGAGYFDFYLLHALGKGNYDSYEKYHLWDFVKELKAKGLIRHYGFSFHDSPEFLDKILTEHPDVDFIQLQINYADWNNPQVQSRGCYEMARKHGKSIVVMEPVKGGTLANPPKSVEEVLRAANPDVSLASWAIRFVASKDGIITVLSGMSNMEQMIDNTSYMKDFRPLSTEEEQVIVKAQEALSSIRSIPCTGCHYCTGGCPMQIPIPEIFSAMNRNLIFGQLEGAKRDYENRTQGRGRASECIECRQCEGACPQHLPVTDYLKECAEALEA